MSKLSVKETLLFWLDEVLRNIRLGLYNLIIWLPTIWCDRNWDSDYLLIIIRKKLLEMADSFECSEISDDQVALMFQITETIDKILANRYYPERGKDLEFVFSSIQNNITYWKW